MQPQTDVVVVCPDCHKVYVQRVTGAYIGPRKRAPNYAVRLQERCKEAGQTFEHGAWYGLMRCTECSLKRCPPSLRETMRAWLEKGENPA